MKNPRIAKNDPWISLLVSDPLFKITQAGQVWRHVYTKGIWRLACVKDPKSDGAAYRTVKYRGKRLALHRVIYEALVGGLDPGKVVDHKDGDHTNNRPDNLELITVAENNRRRYKGGENLRIARKLGQQGALKIRELAEKGLNNTEILRILGPEYGVSARSTIRDVVLGKTWKNQ